MQFSVFVRSTNV